MFNSKSENVFNFNFVNKWFFFFQPCHILLQLQSKLIGTSEHGLCSCCKKAILKVSALLVEDWLTNRPHVVIIVPVDISVPKTRFCAVVSLQKFTIDSTSMLFEKPSNRPVTQVKELLRRALILILIMMLFIFIFLSWCINLIGHNRALTCWVRHSTHMLKMHKNAIIVIST